VGWHLNETRHLLADLDTPPSPKGDIFNI
jgi:hypothetical protein